MKRMFCLLLCACVLTGCAGPKTYETLTDLYYTPTQQEPAQITLWLPDDAALSVLEREDGGRLYLCDGYTVSVQTVASGNLDATLQNATGYGKENLKGIGWKEGSIQRYECAWASAGEEGDQVGRTVVLDDGNYHYVVTVMGQAALAGNMAETWAMITDSVNLDTGSAQPDTAVGIDQ